MKRKEQLKDLAAFCGTTSKCPYCDFELEKIPKRKVKCKSCKKSIYPRKEPLSGEQRLYCEGDLFLLEELKALADGCWNDWYEGNKGVLNARKDLAKEWNVDEVNVSIADARWRESHTVLAEATEKQDWDRIYSAYESMLRQVQCEKSQNKTPLAELVAGFMVTGYGRNWKVGGYTMDHRISRPQFMLIDQLTTEPDSVYDLIKDTRTAKSYCHLLDVSLDTIIKRYMAELNEEATLVRQVENDRNKDAVIEVSLKPIESAVNAAPPKPQKAKSSQVWIFLVGLIVLVTLALSAKS
ncbi:hypothetical protein HWQ46_18055 [Shewanella sp. D64]|uniref:hypothetical protein n=1 Tax=unclassified Shewanella TaxID=196818 RepID=UPI0022BA3380|nr:MULTISPECIES: hypothetical protein [unclassified Shewanella]MEC4727451.1 hypothetical protein [Shewanella sp. D64]MEC4738139.1 hypothetical protein [Shewanella sp. E94]WBJ96348.1 hypothetical protein HWQ47_04280 [Shewanella sp. MTB7]